MATLTVNGSTTYQTISGVGSNVNSWSWKGGEITPALDLLVDTLGHNIFRVVHDRMTWAGTGSTRPAATLTGLASRDPSTLIQRYETSDMQDLWSTIAYLNGKGVTGDQIIVNFMGWTAAWMGGSDGYGTPSAITNNAQTNQDAATMLASLVYYGHHRGDINASFSNLSFGYLGPFNECDWNGLEGPTITTSQLNTIYTNIINTLATMGDTTTKLAGPDTAQWPEPYSSVFSAWVLARMTHIGWHSYGGNTNPSQSQGGVPADWLSETAVSCPG